MLGTCIFVRKVFWGFVLKYRKGRKLIMTDFWGGFFITVWIMLCWLFYSYYANKICGGNFDILYPEKIVVNVVFVLVWIETLFLYYL